MNSGTRFEKLQHTNNSHLFTSALRASLCCFGNLESQAYTPAYVRLVRRLEGTNQFHLIRFNDLGLKSEAEVNISLSVTYNRALAMFGLSIFPLSLSMLWMADY